MSAQPHRYGPNGHIVDVFITHLKQMSKDDWKAVYSLVDHARDAAGPDKWEAARNAAQDIERYAVGEAEWETVWEAVWDAATDAARLDDWCAAYDAECAALEIQGADLLRERGQPFFFLPMFGFADERAICELERLK